MSDTMLTVIEVDSLDEMLERAPEIGNYDMIADIVDHSEDWYQRFILYEDGVAKGVCLSYRTEEDDSGLPEDLAGYCDVIALFEIAEDFRGEGLGKSFLDLLYQHVLTRTVLVLPTMEAMTFWMHMDYADPDDEYAPWLVREPS